MGIYANLDNDILNVEPLYYATMSDMVKRIECKQEDAKVSIHTIPIGTRYTIMLITRGYNTDYVYKELHFYQKFCPTYRYSIDEEIKRLMVRYADSSAFDNQTDIDKSEVICSNDDNLIVLTTGYELCNNTEYTIQLDNNKIINVQIKELI